MTCLWRATLKQSAGNSECCESNMRMTPHVVIVNGKMPPRDSSEKSVKCMSPKHFKFRPFPSTKSVRYLDSIIYLTFFVPCPRGGSLFPHQTFYFYFIFVETKISHKITKNKIKIKMSCYMSFFSWACLPAAWSWMIHSPSSSSPLYKCQQAFDQHSQYRPPL